MANGLLGAIINPAQADVIGAFDKGRERQATGLAGQILGETFTGKIGALARLSPDKAIALSKAVGIPLDDAGRLNNFMGTAVAANKLVQAGLIQEATQFVTEAADKIESIAGPGQASRMRDMANRMQSGDPQAFEQLGQLAQAFDPQGPSALDQARTAEIVAKTEQIGAAPEVSALDKARTAEIVAKTELLDKSNPADQLKIQELKLKIENQQAVVEDRKQNAINASSQRDSTAVASAFEAQGAIANIDDLLRDDAFEDIYGVGDKFIPTIFSGAVALEAKRDQIVALLGLESRQKLKGQGTISDSEARSLADSATLLGNPGIDEVTAKKELKKVRLIFQRAQARAMNNPEARIQIGIAAKKARLEELREKAAQ